MINRILMALVLLSPIVFTLGCRAEFQGGSYNGFIVFFDTPMPGARYTEFNIVFRKEGDRWTGYIQPKNERAAEFGMTDVAFGGGQNITFTAGVKKRDGRAETIAFNGEFSGDKLEGRIKHNRQLNADDIRPAWLVASKQGIKMTREEAERISAEHNVTQFMVEYAKRVKQGIREADLDLGSQRDQSKRAMSILYEKVPDLPPGLVTLATTFFSDSLPYTLRLHLSEPPVLASDIVGRKILGEVIYTADFDFANERWTETFKLEWHK